MWNSREAPWPTGANGNSFHLLFAYKFITVKIRAKSLFIELFALYYHRKFLFTNLFIVPDLNFFYDAVSFPRTSHDPLYYMHP